MTSTPFPHVFQTGRIGSLELPNRIIMGAMHVGIESGSAPRALAEFYLERARGGVALIITGGSAVSRVGAGGRHYTFINEPEGEAQLHASAHAVHEAGGKIALQLFHAGRYASEASFGLPPLAPSPVPSRFSKTPPLAMSAEDIARTIEDFACGAERARRLGFDAVEIMGSEGYLLNQFLSPLTNRREDEWGGDFERRTRFPLAILESIRRRVGADYPIIYRASGTDLMTGSTSEQDALRFARLLTEHGADAIEVGVGWHESPVPTVQFTVQPGAWVELAERIADAVRTTPVIASTRINTIELAERVLAGGKIAFAALARPFLADAQIVAKSRAGRAQSVNPCIACNQACIDRSLRDLPVSCMVNPRAGSEWKLREDTPHGRRGSFGIIGGGPAGLEAARVLATRGHEVVIYEAGERLGGQFRLASYIPGKADYARTITYFEDELDRLGVDVRLHEHIGPESAGELGRHDGIILATGVGPRKIDLPGATLPLVRAYPDAIRECAPGDDSVAIIGAGGIGIDVAHLFSQRGHRVHLMCRGKKAGTRLGRSTRWVILQELRQRGVHILTGISYERITPEGVWAHTPDEPPSLIRASTVIISAGQESREGMSATLQQLAVPTQIVGGARSATELDAVRAFREGALAAHAFADALNT